MTLMKVITSPAMASPRTNLAAPSIAPKKVVSSSSVVRLSRACVSSISPEERSASIAICLPGIASNANRAATSAIRPEPLVMTTKFTSTKMAKTMMPITKLPLMTKLPKASITRPAAPVPSWPFDRIRRVDARLSASRETVAMSRIVGNELKSSGLWMNIAVIRTSTEKVIDVANAKSSSQLGIGRMRMTRIRTTPSASPISPCLRSAAMPANGFPSVLAAATGSAVSDDTVPGSTM